MEYKLLAASRSTSQGIVQVIDVIQSWTSLIADVSSRLFNGTRLACLELDVEGILGCCALKHDGSPEMRGAIDSKKLEWHE